MGLGVPKGAIAGFPLWRIPGKRDSSRFWTPQTHQARTAISPCKPFYCPDNHHHSKPLAFLLGKTISQCARFLDHWLLATGHASADRSVLRSELCALSSGKEPTPPPYPPQGAETVHLLWTAVGGVENGVTLLGPRRLSDPRTLYPAGTGAAHSRYREETLNKASDIECKTDVRRVLIPSFFRC